MKIRIFGKGSKAPEWVQKVEPEGSNKVTFGVMTIAILWRGITHLYPLISSPCVLLVTSSDTRLPRKCIGNPTHIHGSIT